MTITRTIEVRAERPVHLYADDVAIDGLVDALPPTAAASIQPGAVTIRLDVDGDDDLAILTEGLAIVGGVLRSAVVDLDVASVCAAIVGDDE
jgi:hypothetical protein